MSGAVSGIEQLAPAQVASRPGPARPGRPGRSAAVPARLQAHVALHHAEPGEHDDRDHGDRARATHASELLGDPRRLALEHPHRDARRSRRRRRARAGARASRRRARPGRARPGRSIHLRASSSSGASGLSSDDVAQRARHLLDRIQHRASRRRATVDSTVQMIARSRKRGYSDETIIDTAVVSDEQRPAPAGSSSHVHIGSTPKASRKTSTTTRFSAEVEQRSSARRRAGSPAAGTASCARPPPAPTIDVTACRVASWKKPNSTMLNSSSTG